MKGEEAYQLLRGVGLALRSREDVTAGELLGLLSQALGEETLSQKRARAGGAGGKRSAEVRGERLGTAQPRSKARSKFEANPEAQPEANPKQNAFASSGAEGSNAPSSSPPLHPLSSPTPQHSSGNAAAKGPESSPEAAAAGDEIREKSKALLAAEHMADYQNSQFWPPVVRVVNAFHESLDLAPAKLGVYSRDSEVRAIVALFASGRTEEELLEAARAARTDAFCLDRRLRGCSILTPPVVTSLLSRRSGVKSTALVRIQETTISEAEAASRRARAAAVEAKALGRVAS